MTDHTQVRSLPADAVLAAVLALALVYPAAPALADPAGSAGPAAACADRPADLHRDTADPCGH
ncbi:hypothetical protein ACFV0O_37965 [Kitasatospora sp. NPDC059577]|uniref:hypothetical protein n=1 Tax=Kitasatospora sp. NPDC059577 TaxID=3346873 RepID=UPI0036B69DED